MGGPALLRCRLLAVCVILAGCPPARTAPMPPTLPMDGQVDAALGPGDVFTVDVFGEKDLSGKFRVSADGTVDYPFAGRIKVAGMTPPAVQSLLRQKLAAGYLKAPNVSVFVDSYNSKKISVLGAVAKPGTFNYMNNMSIIEAIALAGGFSPMAAKNSVTVTRNERGRAQRFVVPGEEIGEGRASNYLLRPGDVVYVPERLF